MLKTIALLLLTLGVASCAGPETLLPTVDAVSAEAEARKQRELALEALVDGQRRLYRIGYSLLRDNVPLCRDQVAPTLGMQVWTSSKFESEWREAFKSRYGVTDTVQVGFLGPDSPAARAGLRVGDKVASVNGWTVPSGDEATSDFQEKLEEIRGSKNPVRLSVRRGTQNVDLSVLPTPACDFELVLAAGAEKNAYADGNRIVVTRGMMDFFKSDEEVALVLSHELAHNAMGHITSKKTNAVVGGIVGFLFDVAAAAAGVNTQGQFTKLGAEAGARTFSVDFEREADYVGLYMMANAGYEIEGAANFWRRMAIQDPKSIELKISHPTTPERFVAIEKAVEEIEGKILRGAELMPEMMPEPRLTETDLESDL